MIDEVHDARELLVLGGRERAEEGDPLEDQRDHVRFDSAELEVEPPHVIRVVKEEMARLDGGDGRLALDCCDERPLAKRAARGEADGEALLGLRRAVHLPMQQDIEVAPAVALADDSAVAAAALVAPSGTELEELRIGQVTEPVHLPQGGDDRQRVEMPHLPRARRVQDRGGRGWRWVGPYGWRRHGWVGSAGWRSSVPPVVR